MYIKLIKGKYIILFLVSFLSFVFLKPVVLKIFNDKNSSVQTQQNASKPVNREESSEDIIYNGNLYRYYWFEVDNVSDLNLYDNFENKLTLDEIIDKDKCKYIINGGFYDKNNLPIGLFQNHFGIINQFEKNVLFNGIFSVCNLDIVRITQSPQLENLRLALQTGPVLISDYKKYKLTESENRARRSVALISEDNRLIFIIVFDGQSVFSGPALFELPSVIEIISDDLGIKTKHALNLDGGSASFFYNIGKKLSELTPVGSYFCIKQSR